MIEPNDLKDSIVRISKILTANGIPFHFTGGIASTYYGEPRFTQDLDIVTRLAAEPSKATKLIAMLHSDYLVDKEAVGSALALRKPFQALDKVTLIKIDFYIAEKIPGELTRSAEHELFPGIKIPLVSLEDSILSKLLWVKEGSEKAKRDIVAMLSANSEIDWPYLKQMAEKLELSTILASLASQYNC